MRFDNLNVSHKDIHVRNSLIYICNNKQTSNLIESIDIVNETRYFTSLFVIKEITFQKGNILPAACNKHLREPYHVCVSIRLINQSSYLPHLKFF